MARIKLTANNHCHKPIKGGAPVEDLIAAAKNGRQACLDYLAGRHPDQICSDNGIGVLHALVRKGSGNAQERSAMELLLSLGASVDALNLRGQTPLLCAVNAGSWWAVPKLHQAGAQMTSCDNRGQTVQSLMEAWIARHPNREDQTRGVMALISATEMQAGVAKASPAPRRPGTRF